jgi:hypothetical protein
MRKTPLPLLRDLPAWVIVRRCMFCQKFVFDQEACESESEARYCPPREVIENDCAALQAV